MNAGPGAAGTGSKVGLPGQAGESDADVVVPQPGSRAGHEQRIADRAGKHMVAEVPVVLDRGRGGRMEREQPVPAELRVPDQVQLPFRVEVGIIERDGFPDPDSGTRPGPAPWRDARPGARQLVPRRRRPSAGAGDPAAARDQYAALLPMQVRVLGPDHPNTLTTRSNLVDWTEKAEAGAGTKAN